MADAEQNLSELLEQEGLDRDTLRTILRYRGFRAGDPEHKIDFGVLGDVAVPGRIAVGDAVTALERVPAAVTPASIA